MADADVATEPSIVPSSEPDAKPAVYAPGPSAVDISPNKDGGVLKEIIRAGMGDERPQNGDTVSVHYVGTLLADGSKFDSSRDRNELFEFQLGKDKVIKGWDVGVATMQRGELAMLVCTAEYAYGAKGSPPKIPGGATLVFEVELFDWKGEDISEEKDGSVVRCIQREGEGYKTPSEMATCSIHVVGRHDGRVFQDEDLTFTQGEVFDSRIPPGVEYAVSEMKENEKSKFKILSRKAYGSAGHAAYGVPPDADLEYEIELKSFVDPKDSWQLDNKEKLAESEASKTRGTELFKAGQYHAALKHYKRVVELISTEDKMQGEEADQRVKLLLASRLNSAMCHLKLDAFGDAIEACNEALKLDARNEKGLFRRGTAHLKLRNYDEACVDFKAALDVDPSNKAARAQLVAAQNVLKQIYDREKATYKGMFARFADEDTKKAKASAAPIHVWKDGEKEGGKTTENGVEVVDKESEAATMSENENVPLDSNVDPPPATTEAAVDA